MNTDAKSLLKGLYQAPAERPLEPTNPLYYIPFMVNDQSEPDPVDHIYTDTILQPAAQRIT